VVPRSPAANAGIEAGDLVISLEGRPILEYGMNELNQLFEDGEPGRTLRLEISRDGKKREVKIRLRDLI
jgi:serine protease DegQ